MLLTGSRRGARERPPPDAFQTLKGEYLNNSLSYRNATRQPDEIRQFRDIPNIGPAIEKDLITLGLNKPAELIGKDPYQMYKDLCTITQRKHDPCIIDVFISAVRFMEGGPAKKWWQFTEERKKHYGI